MTRIFLDTNFIIDLTSREEYKPVCLKVLAKGKEMGMNFYVSFLSLANFAYINRKKTREELNNDLSFLCDKFIVLPNEKQQILEAIKLNASDFEDGIQYGSAKSGGCHCIITRNQKDFEFSEIPVFTPDEFLSNI